MIKCQGCGTLKNENSILCPYCEAPEHDRKISLFVYFTLIIMYSVIILGVGVLVMRYLF